MATPSPLADPHATVDVRRAPAARERAPVSRRRLWSAILAGPAAYLLNHEALYLLSAWTCPNGHRWLMHATALLFALVSLGGAWVGWRNWQIAGREPPTAEGGPLPRSRFMGLIGVAFGLFFFVVVVALWIPVAVVGPCEWW